MLPDCHRPLVKVDELLNLCLLHLPREEPFQKCCLEQLACDYNPTEDTTISPHLAQSLLLELVGSQLSLLNISGPHSHRDLMHLVYKLLRISDFLAPVNMGGFILVKSRSLSAMLRTGGFSL